MFSEGKWYNPGGAAFDTTLIGNSAWVDGSADYLNKTPSAGTTTRWIWASWVQRTEFGNAANAHTIFSAGSSLSNLSWIRFDDQDHFDFAVYQGATTARKTSSAKYRDIGWYHLCVSFDSGSGVTASDRIKLFVNGIEVTELSANTDTPSGETTAFNDNVTQEIGRYSYNGSQYGHAYLTQFTMLENKSFQNSDLAITDLLDSYTFGTSGSQFGPKADSDIAALASSAGGRSFCLDFANSSDLGNDISSNNNDFTPNSMAAVNQSTNTPSNVTATLNPLIPNASIAYSEGNTKITHTAFTQVVPATIFATAGKFYAEILIGKTGTWAGYNGVVPADDQAGPNWVYPTGDGFIWVSNGTLNHVSAYPSVTTTYTNGDRLMFGLDVDNGWLFIGKNDTWYDASGNSFTDLTDSDNAVATNLLTVSTAGWTFAPGASHVSGTTTEQIFLEASSWAYTAPTDFVSLSSANLTAPDAQGVDHFAVTLAQEGSLFSAMNTAEAAYSATLRIYKSRASASASETWGYSFSHDSSNEYILPAANTAMTYGSIRSLSGTDNWVGYSLNISATAGTAAGSQAHSNGSDTTVTHSLGSSRYIVLLFSRSGGDIFYYHPDVASGSLLKFNSSVLPFSSTVITDITTNSFDIGSAAGSATYDYLVLTETPGVIDIFSYIGNGSTNGPYLSLNAQPEFWTAKLTTTHATEHVVLDQTRSPFNDADIEYLLPNQLTAEANNTAFVTDFLSTAVKLRNASTDLNFSGGTFVGWSFGKIAGGGTLPPVYGK